MRTDLKAVTTAFRSVEIDRGLNKLAQQTQQQTGVLFIMTQQVQPGIIMPVMQSQQDWIMAQHVASPLVQVMQQPSSVISHLHIPIMRLQQQTIMPFIMTQQLHMPPAIMVQRFCIMAAVTLSSQTHLIIMPPSHFSKVIVQRGTIIMLMPVALVDEPIMPVGADIFMFMPAMLMPVIPMPALSFIMVVVIGKTPALILILMDVYRAEPARAV